MLPPTPSATPSANPGHHCPSRALSQQCPTVPLVSRAFLISFMFSSAHSHSRGFPSHWRVKAKCPALTCMALHDLPIVAFLTLFLLYSQDLSFFISRGNKSTLPFGVFVLNALSALYNPPHGSHVARSLPSVALLFEGGVALSKIAIQEHSNPSPHSSAFPSLPVTFSALLILLVCPDYFLFLHVEFVSSTKARATCLFCSLYCSRYPIKNC